MKGRNVSVVAVLFVALLSIAVAPESNAQNNAQDGDEHCVLQVGEGESGRIRCFATFAKAISVATDGRVRLDPEMPPNQITQEMLDQGQDRNQERAQSAAQQDTVIGIPWAGAREQGASLVYTFDGGCRDAPEIQAPTMPSNWNDRISSSHSYGGCRTIRHYEDRQFGGSIRDCSPACGELGAMNNETSSLKWFR